MVIKKSGNYTSLLKIPTLLAMIKNWIIYKWNRKLTFLKCEGTYILSSLNVTVYKRSMTS